MDDIAMDNELAAWDDRQPAFEKEDPLWSLLAYRLSRYAMALLRADLRHTRRIDPETRDQLTRATSSIAANISEAYSRSTPRERSRFYSYALGSAREAGVWYASIADALPPGVPEARCAVLSRIRKLVFGLMRKGDAPRWPGPRRKSEPPPPPAV
jgi:four helix bundle protein